MADFGPWVPDQPHYNHAGLVVARNVMPREGGYEPVKSLTAFTGALPSTWRGGGWFQGEDGTSVILAGTNAGLHVLTALSATNVFAGTYSAPWNFAQFGNLVVCVNGQAPLKHNIVTGAASLLGGSPPISTMCAIVRDFVFLAGNPSKVSTVTWSASNNAEGWTVGTAQCDEQLIPDGGEITGLVGGEYGVVFQADAINLFEYVGAPVIFQRRKVSDAVGAICPGAIARFDSRVFFLHRKGFFMLASGELIPIGRTKVDRTFLSLYSVDDIKNNVRCVVDPANSRVMWTMPGRIWVYNWEMDRWTDIALSGVVGLTAGATASTSLEDLTATFPSLDAMTISLDDPKFQGGDPLLLAVKSDNMLYAFAGETLEASLQMPRTELFPGREAIVRNSQLIGDVPAATVTIEARKRIGDAPMSVQSNDLRENGDIPIRVTGRYLTPGITIAAGTVWTFAQGFELQAAPGGRL